MKSLRLLNIANLYILFWCIYFLQGVLYAKGSIISQVILALLLLVSFYNFYCVSRYRDLPSYFKGLNVLLMMFTLYGGWLILVGDKFPLGGSNISYLKQIYISLLPIYSSYMYTKKQLLTDKILMYWIPIWLLLATCSFYFNRQQVLIDRYDDEEITNNIGYTFLALMPAMILFRKRPILAFVGIFYCLFFILMGMKRGAIGIGGLVFCYFVFRMYKGGNLKMRLWIFCISFVVIMLLWNVVESLIFNSDYFAARIEMTLEGNTSGRDALANILLDHFWNETNFGVILFGNGADATLRIASNYAHNDWIEILINQGLIGTGVYLMYFILFIKSWRRLKYNYSAYTGVGLILLIAFLQTLFSMSYGSMEIYLTISLGYFLAQPCSDKCISNV